MPCTKYQYTDVNEAKKFFASLSARDESSPEIDLQVIEILKNIKENHDNALLEYTQKFDAPHFQGSFRVPEHNIAEAAASIPPQDYAILQDAASHITYFHEMQKEKSWFHTKSDGTILGQKVEPIERAGIYVPGGRKGNTPLISSLLMGAIPALVAGVSEIAVVSPPREDGTLNPYILAAAYLLDIREVYAVGGAWSIAALAYGTPTIKAVDIITGPGNAYVASAKRMLQGKVGIDMVAGPSEILIIADEKANPDYIAADMLSQAEHDTMASALLVTDSQYLADKVLKQLEIRLQNLPRKDIAKEALEKWSGLVVLPNIMQCIEFSNFIAPEHLEVMIDEPFASLPFIKNAGAIFLGPYSSESAGDYFAGPNHVLPTMSTARFSSGLSVSTFTKKSNVLSISKQFVAQNAASIARLARLESLEAHAQAIEARKK